MNSNEVAEPLGDDGQGPGAILGAERTRQGLTLEEVADKLKLSSRIVAAIEADRYDRLPGLAFARGFVRNYARLLGLDEGQLVGRLPGSEKVQTPKPVAQPANPIRYKEQVVIFGGKRGRQMKMIVAAAAVVFVLGAVAAAITQSRLVGGKNLRITEETPAVQGTAGPAPLLPAVGSAGAAPAAASAGTAVVAGAQATAGAAATAGEAAPAGTAATAGPAATAGTATTMGPAATSAMALPAAGPARLEVQADEKSWLQVVDARGKRLFAGTVRPGAPETLTGRAPLKVVIGDAPHVRVRFNDRDVDLAAATRGQVAHLTLK